MADSATILIPDISGYTDFLSRTDVEHSAHIINHLLDRIVESIDKGFRVSEIEGDAVLLYKKGIAPNKKEIVDQCIKTFTIFQNEIRGIKNIVICQCSACQDVTNLTLKFVIHFGTIAEINVGQFMKASGIDMVIAHRLLKNNIPEHEYLLTTNSYLKNVSDGEEAHDLLWFDATEEYPSIGIVEFRFASLVTLKNSIQATPRKNAPLLGQSGQAISVELNETLKEVLSTLVSMEKRLQYVEGVKGIDGPPRLLMGPHYYYIMDEGKAEVEPRFIESKGNEVVYEEYVTLPETGFYAFYHMHLKSLPNNRCLLTWSVAPQPGHVFTDAIEKLAQERLAITTGRFKEYCDSHSSMASTPVPS